MKILLFDIENAPSKAYIWQSKTYFVPNDMIFEEWYMLCWSAKWLDSDEIMTSALCYGKDYKKDLTNDYEVARDLWNLFDEADVIIAHNAVNFDVKKANARFIYHGMTPPSPYKVVDTLQIARRTFKFTSNKLDYVGRRLGIGKKKENAGMVLWERCMGGDIKAWKEMIEYCEQDVILLEGIYKKFLPYIKNHPNMSIDNREEPTCPKCGSKNLMSRGREIRLTGFVRRFSCKDCGGWGQVSDETFKKWEKKNIIRNA